MTKRELAKLDPISNLRIRTAVTMIERSIIPELIRSFQRYCEREADRREASRVRRILGWPPYGRTGEGIKTSNSDTYAIVDMPKRRNA